MLLLVACCQTAATTDPVMATRLSRRQQLALSIMLISSVSLAHDIDQDEALRLRRSGEIQPLETLLIQVYQRHPDARLLDVELEREHGRLIYEIEILTKPGQVRELELDARTGEFIKDKIDD